MDAPESSPANSPDESPPKVAIGPFAGAAVLIAIVSGLVFANTGHNAFHLDDFYRVVGNPGVEEFWPPFRHFVDPSTSATLPRIVQYRPLLPLTLSLQHAFFGHDLMAYHVGNWVIHTMASVFVLGMCCELLSGRLRPALAVALAFAVHPVSGITVNYICSRDLSLMVMFASASFWTYLLMRRRGASVEGWVVCLGCFALALMSKTSAVVLPGVILFYEITIGRSWPWRARVVAGVLPFVLVAAGVFAFVRYGLEFSDLANIMRTRGDTKASELATEYATGQLQHHVFYYLRNFAWPFAMRLDADVPVVAWKWIVGAVVIGLGWLLALWSWRRRPVVTFGIAAYSLWLLPTSSVLPLWADVVDYRPYPGTPFLFLAFAVLLSARPRLGWIVAVGAVSYFGFASYKINPIWKTEESLWSHSVAQGAQARAHLNYGMSLQGQPRRDALAKACALDPDYLLAHINLGLTDIYLGAKEDGLQRIERAVARQPGRAQSHYWLAEAYADVGRPEDAVRSAKKAVELHPGNAKYQAAVTRFEDAWITRRYQIGRQLQGEGKIAESLPHLEYVRERKAYHGETEFLVAFALADRGDRAAAIALYKKFLARHPKHDQGWFNLGYAQVQERAWRDAVHSFTQCLHQNPKQYASHFHLANCYRELGETQRSVQHERLYEAGKQARRAAKKNDG